MKDVRSILEQRVLVFDGAMGTYYQTQPGQECEQANLTDPEGILRVHRAYLAAGAEALKTNTFGLPRMAAAGAPGWQTLAEAGWRLACQAAGEKAAVFADLGPAPDTEGQPAAAVYKRVAEVFLAQGAKNFLFETLSSDAGVAEAAAYIKERCPEAFLLVSFAVLPDGYTREGLRCRVLAQRMAGCGAADAVGLNCVSAPSAMEKLLPELAGLALPLAVMPNAGYPIVTRSRVVYQGKPDYFAQTLCRIRQKGAVILGGCCGTTPEHIAALRQALEKTPMPISPETAPAVPAEQKTMPAPPDALLEGLADGRKVIAVELDSLCSHFHCCFRSKKFTHCSICRIWQSCILLPCSRPYKQPCGLYLSFKICHLELCILESRDRASELFSLFSIFYSLIHCSLSYTESL